MTSFSSVSRRMDMPSIDGRIVSASDASADSCSVTTGGGTSASDSSAAASLAFASVRSTSAASCSVSSVSASTSSGGRSSPSISSYRRRGVRGTLDTRFATTFPAADAPDALPAGFFFAAFFPVAAAADAFATAFFAFAIVSPVYNSPNCTLSSVRILYQKFRRLA